MNMELEILFQRSLDGTLTAEEMVRLNARLRTDAEARREFAELLNLDSALAATAAGWMPETVPSRVVGSVRRKFIAILVTVRWFAVAACLGLLVSGVWWWQATQRVFATVHESAGVEELAAGMVLRGEPQEIKAGTVELITARGARVVIEAPAEFRFESPQRLRMLRGRLAADVPPSAKGFTVITPAGEAVDLGTRFGVDVPTTGAAEIHVFQGEVIANAAGTKTRQSLRGGEALTLSQGAGAARELRSSAFIQPDEMPEMIAGLAAGQRSHSAAASAALRHDAALIALVDFEPEAAPPGVFRRVQGRWPGSRALEFVDTDDHAKLNLNATTRKLTLMTWVRLDRVPEGISSLYHTDGWDTPGQVHWMVLNNGQMRFGMHSAPANGDNGRERWPESRAPLLGQLGRWVHLAAVYDADTKQVSFYTNGKFDSTVAMKAGLPAVLGPAQIGNWNLKNSFTTQHRRLSGRMDELVALGRTLTAEEVRGHYEAGNPYQ